MPDEKAAEASMRIVDEARAPVLGGRENNLDLSMGAGLPVIHLVDFAESATPEQGSHPLRNHDRLSRRNPPERLHVQMIVVRVRNEYEVDRREIPEPKARHPRPLHHRVPHCPVRIDEDIARPHLHEEGRVADPGDRDLLVLQFREKGALKSPGSAGENARNDPLTDELEIPATPALFREQTDLVLVFRATPAIAKHARLVTHGFDDFLHVVVMWEGRGRCVLQYHGGTMVRLAISLSAAPMTRYNWPQVRIRRRMSPANKKTQQRQESLAALRALSPAVRLEKSAAIVARLLAHPVLRSSPKALVLAYAALPSEPDLSALPLQAPVVPFCLPRVADHFGLTVHRVPRFTGLIPSNKNIGEPDPSLHPEVMPEEITLVLVPGITFSTRTGHRLGRGGGYYDRFLARPELARARRIGICFDEQAIPEIPFEAHDCRVSEILTDLRWIRIA